MKLSRLFFLWLLIAGPAPLAAAEKAPVTLYKSPECGCCEGHVAHLREHGYAVTVRPMPDLSALKRMYGVPNELASCHTAVIGSYVVEGHVPASIVDRLLRERPAIRGIALPGMPAGSPGMPGPKTEPFVIYELTGGPPKVYAVD